MGEQTAISWTDHTWNPWVGCRKVSAGCKNCYMFREQERYGRDPLGVRRTAPATFDAPLHWKEPGLVFTCSWSDFFIEEADDWREEAWSIMEHTPHLIYQVLTKRAENIETRLPQRWDWTFVSNSTRFPENVWLGVTAENEKELFSRYPILQSVIKDWLVQTTFLSLEPLLGPIDIEPVVEFTEHDDDSTLWYPGVDWVIVGGESGPDARPMNLDWARSIRDQCAEYGIPFFFKQVGGSKKIGGAWGGDLLDGQRYHEFPETTKAIPEQMSFLE
jgi:protein gp37